MICDGLVVLGTGDYGDATMGAPTSTRKIAAARDLEVVDVLSGGDGVGGRWLMGRQ